MCRIVMSFAAKKAIRSLFTTRPFRDVSGDVILEDETVKKCNKHTLVLRYLFCTRSKTQKTSARLKTCSCGASKSVHLSAIRRYLAKLRTEPMKKPVGRQRYAIQFILFIYHLQRLNDHATLLALLRVLFVCVGAIVTSHR